MYAAASATMSAAESAALTSTTDMRWAQEAGGASIPVFA